VKASMRIGETMSTAITSLTERIPSPSATRDESLADSGRQGGEPWL
jgi:hypothetical protein